MPRTYTYIRTYFLWISFNEVYITTSASIWFKEFRDPDARQTYGSDEYSPVVKETHQRDC